MSDRIIRFPARRGRAIWILPLAESGFLVLCGTTGWLHGSHTAALEDAQWLATNFGFPIREGTQ